jgi:hypothetical protein
MMEIKLMTVGKLRSSHSERPNREGRASGAYNRVSKSKFA